MAGMLGVSGDATSPLAEMVMVTPQWGRRESVAVGRQHPEIGAKWAGRNPEDLQFIFRATTIMRDDQQEARERAHAAYLRVLTPPTWKSP